MKIVRPPPIERIGATRAARQAIEQYVVLSMLLHVFAIIALGDTRGGESRSGLRGQGSILVTLNGPVNNDRINERINVRGNRTSVAARSQRVAAPNAVLPVVPGDLATIEAPRVDQSFAPTPSIPPGASSAFRAEPLAPIEPPITATISETPRLTPAIQRPAALEPLAPIIAPTTATLSDAPRLPTSQSKPSALEPITPLAPIAPPKIESGFADRVEVRPAQRPALTTLEPVRASDIKAFNAPSPTLTRDTASAPAPALQPIERIAQPAIGPFAAPVDTKALEAARPPGSTLQPLSPVAPAALTSEFASNTIPKPGDTPLNLPGTLDQIAAPNVDAEFATFTPPAAGEPTRGEQVNPPRSDPLLPGASTQSPVSPGMSIAVPTVDLDRIKDRARNLARQGTGPRTAIPFFTAPPPPKKDVEKAFDKALKRPECKDAYADMGLAAVVPLIRDALTEKGCKW